MYELLDTRNGRIYRYKTAIEANAVRRIKGMQLLGDWDNCPPQREDVAEIVARTRFKGIGAFVLIIITALIVGVLTQVKPGG